ncbi:MAG: aconitase X swivel domain-containing protein [Clostridia bacterium]
MQNDSAVRGRTLVKGAPAAAPLVVTDHPLSFWGGYDPVTGRIVDRHHPLYGVECAGRVLALPAGRGSSTGSAVLLEAIRAGTAPAALIISRVDPILALGLVVADELYQQTRSLVLVRPEEWGWLHHWSRAIVDPAGWVQGELPVVPAAP